MKQYYFTDPDDITGRTVILMDDFIKKIEKRNLFDNPFFFDGMVMESADKETFDYMLREEILK